MTAEVNTPQQRIWLLVPFKDLPQVKDILLKDGLLDQNESIVYNPRVIQQEFSPLQDLRGKPQASDFEQNKHQTHTAVPTSLQYDASCQDQLGSNLLKDSQLDEWTNVSLATRLLNVEPQKRPPLSPRNEFAQAIERWRRCLPGSIGSAVLNEDRLLSSSTWRFTKYPPLLILPAGTFSQEPWPSVLAALPQEQTSGLYACIADRLGVTHIAEQGPIPAQVRDQAGSETPRDNVLRSPLGLRPLYGTFGPLAAEPTPDAFAHALWVTVRQHRIAQVFAPLYTMFANGNVNEKRRVRDIAEADWGVSGLAKAAAIDLYAGIGYFAFSYAKAGYAPVLCWELNGWSVEGLRRGAEQNGWTCAVINENEKLTDARIRSVLDCTFIVFHESNARATRRLKRLRTYIPPVRHINCGYLPTSLPSRETSLRALDLRNGGWIHVHENCAVEELDSGSRQTEVLAAITSLENCIGGRPVSIRHVERVKSYAPGVMHCVFDALVGPISSGASEASSADRDA